MLSVESVDVGYRGQPVLKGLTLPPVGAGHITALVGPNAAGKSTLLKAIAGAVPYRGEIRLSGAPLSGMAARERASKIAYMPQFSAGGSGLTVLEGVTATLAMAGQGARHLGRAQAARRAVDVLEELGIGELALRPMNRLSGGQRQLASLAQALAVDPQVLLLDEPTSALDLGHQVRVMSLARRFSGKDRVVIAAVHDLALAATYATQVIVMQEGRIAASGAPKDTITAELLARVYGVDAKVTLDDEGHFQIVILRESA